MSEEKAAYNPADGMMSLKGKQYLPVAERIVWFRSDYPEGVIETRMLELDREQGFALFHARVETGKGGEAGATGSETKNDFGDYIEKAETKAVGRALGYLGYGTAAAGFEEGPRVVDAPQAPRNRTAPQRPPERAQQAPAPPRPPVAAAPTPAPEPLTDEQERIVAEARDMAEAKDSYHAVAALIRTMERYATPGQWLTIKRQFRTIREKHYPDTLKKEEVQP